jgi:hypothetical protein
MFRIRWSWNSVTIYQSILLSSCDDKQLLPLRKMLTVVLTPCDVAQGKVALEKVLREVWVYFDARPAVKRRAVSKNLIGVSDWKSSAHAVVRVASQSHVGVDARLYSLVEAT